MAATKLTTTEALDQLASYDHALIGQEHVEPICTALGMARRPELTRYVDTRWQFKGTTINKADGYLDINEWVKWFNQEWSYVKRDVRGTTKTKLMMQLWAAYMLEDERGVPYAEGIDASVFAEWLCRELAVKYQSCYGRGSQLRECVRALRARFGEEAVA